MLMDNRDEVREFLISRRAKITPAEAGLPIHGERRVPGLRRGEVAALAGVSVEYYAKLERGAIAGASASMLDAIARALQLDDAERAHLFRLAHAADGTTAGMRPRRRPSKRWQPRPGLQWVLDAFTAPAIVRNGRMDQLATNPLGRATHATVYEATGQPVPNFVRFTFLHLDAAHDFYPDWDLAADTSVAILHTEAGRDPHDKNLHDLVGELSTRSDDFRRRWDSRNVLTHGAGQTVTPPRCRRPPAGLRERGHAVRPRTHPHLVRRRTRLTHRLRPRPARLLDQPHRHTVPGHNIVTRAERSWGVPTVRPSTGCSSPWVGLLASTSCPPISRQPAASPDTALVGLFCSASP
jgi:transcriptional regulator with XRE-family HTH domain